MIHPLDSIATHLVTQLVDVGADVMDTGGGCTALAWRDPRSPEDYSPITLTDGDHGVAFAHTGVILVTLEDPEGVDQWWEYPAINAATRERVTIPFLHIERLLTKDWDRNQHSFPSCHPDSFEVFFGLHARPIMGHAPTT